MRRSTAVILAALGLLVGGVGAMARVRSAAAQPMERFTLFEMFGRVS
ncbi:MAG: hypothetical protein IT332_09505 [Ardenticatenales bacterium]|jgi:hypothetical protein|nr:hypothetical protein [Ardenticatenales bacterium]